MSRFAGAKWRPIPRYQPGGSAGGEMPAPTRLILHTAVSASSSLFDLFNQDGNPVAHAYVTGEGESEQYVDTARRASAVLDGNANAVTIETQDKGAGFPDWDGSNVPAWTDAQVEALARWTAFCNREHGIPVRALNHSKPGGRGVATHRSGCDGNFPKLPPSLRGRVSDGEHWSTSFGKVCPGDRRIKQRRTILRRARHIVARGLDNKPAPTKTNRIQAALLLVHQAIQDMKPSKRRDVLIHAAKLLRKAAR